MMDFHNNATINHKNKTILFNTIVLYTISQCFSGFKIRYLVAQIVDSQNGPCMGQPTLTLPISAHHHAIFTQKHYGSWDTM
jgi:hypothetical protein